MYSYKIFQIFAIHAYDEDGLGNNRIAYDALTGMYTSLTSVIQLDYVNLSVYNYDCICMLFDWCYTAKLCYSYYI
jgi:hypothetical protein